MDAAAGKTRKRFTEKQIKVLESIFQKNPNIKGNNGPNGHVALLAKLQADPKTSEDFKDETTVRLLTWFKQRYSPNIRRY